MTASHLRPDPARAGNAILIAMAFIAMLVSLVAISTDRAVASVQNTSRGLNQQRVVAAVEAVLARRELMVVTLGNRGDPTEFSRWKENFGIENYGVDYLGECEVRWKIEPVRTFDKTALGEDIPFIENPSPSASLSSVGKQLPNDYIYLFRVAAEARINGTLKDSSGEVTPIARAQGVRYASVSKQPLFRYVIFYAQNGAKGDLELSHSSSVNIRGNVHSNGAIYMGSSTLVNTWESTRPTNLQTVVGPDADGKDVFITGVNGIFRLSKPLMYGAVNQAGDPSWSSLTLGGTSPSGWSPATAYSLESKAFPTEIAIPPTSTVYASTLNGTVINPYRVLDTSGFVTIPLSGTANYRTINGTPLIGYGALANDSRDDDRTAKWNPLSLGGPGATAADPSGFRGFARTALTTGRVVRLPNDLTNRPLEAQAIAEIDADGDPTTDNHEAAKPKFRKPDGTDTTDFDFFAATDPLVETPGVYLKYALGSDKVCLTRRIDGTGWDVTDNAGLAITAQPASVGLVIRERLVPDTTMWPGTTNAPVIDPTNPMYMPYAYGKHWRPTAIPFLAMDIVAASAYDNSSWSLRSFSNYRDTSPMSNIGNDDAWRFFDMSGGNRVDSYEGEGVFKIRTACEPGPDYPGTAAPGESGFAGIPSPDNLRPTYFFQENWRFLHLRKPLPTTTPGVVATYWNDTFDNTKYHYNLNGGQQATMSGPAAMTRAEDNVNMPGSPGAGVLSDHISGRWEGFFIPEENASYQFGVHADDQARVWVNNQLVVSQPNYNSENIYPGKTLIMKMGERYPVVVEFSESGGGENCYLKFRKSGGLWATVPRERLVTRDPDYGFSWKDFRSLQARIVVRDTVPANAKIGIMVRPSEGASPLQNGRDAYGAALFSPTRGFFSQRRLIPAVTDGFQRQAYTNFLGSTAPTSPTPADGNGQVYVPISATNPIRQALLTPTAPWTTTTGSSGIYSVAQDSTKVDVVYDLGNWVQGLADIDGGDGTEIRGMRVGPVGGFSLRVTKFRYVRPATYSAWNKTRTGTMDLVMTGHVGLFNPASDELRDISFYDAAVGSVADRAWGANDYEVLNGTTLRRSDTQTNWSSNQGANDYTGTWVASTTGVRNDAANERVIFPPLPRRYSYAGVDLGELTPAEAIGVMETKNGGSYTYRSTTPNWPVVADPIDSGVRPAETGSVPDPGYPAVDDPWGGTVSRHFNINRDTTTVQGFQDVNAYATTGAHIFPAAAPVRAFLPWQVGWSVAGDPLLSVAPLPMTTSFPPTIWRSAASPRREPWDGVTDLADAPVPVVNQTGRWSGDMPATGWTYDPALNHLVRIERDMTTAVPTLRFYAYVGNLTSPPPADPGWFELPGSLLIQPWLDSYLNRADVADPTTMQLLVGLVAQSGDRDTAIDAEFADVAIEVNTATGIDTIDKVDWDGQAGGARFLSRYLASQYQVLWGIYDITEDFFSFGETNANTRLATEDWIYNAREFWSQSRWWDDARTMEKDGWVGPVRPSDWDTYDDLTNRKLLSKTTLLTLNMRTLQDYLKARTLTAAVVPVMTNTINGSTLPGPALPSGIALTPMARMFNGLFYPVRTNRYQWNPDPTKANAWGARDLPLPNTGVAASVNYTRLNDASFPYDVSGVNKLQPYDLAEAPPFKPQDFIHAVRITNGSSIDWGFPATGAKFGDSKTSVVTPNQLFVQGNLNSTQRLVAYKSQPTAVMKETPLAVMGDVVVLLSNRFRDVDYQTPELRVGNSSVSGGGILSLSGGKNYNAAGVSPGNSPNATIYATSILTHNSPTTKAGVKEGQGAPFIDTMMFLEAWPSGGSEPTMRFKGSLVVMNSRRYTQAFLLDAPKRYGRTPLGITGWHKSSPDWAGECTPVYAAPFRGFDFNNDLLTEEGTPPFTPFGVTAAGVGGYTTILQ